MQRCYDNCRSGYWLHSHPSAETLMRSQLAKFLDWFFLNDNTQVYHQKPHVLNYLGLWGDQVWVYYERVNLMDLHLNVPKPHEEISGQLATSPKSASRSYSNFWPTNGLLTKQLQLL